MFREDGQISQNKERHCGSLQPTISPAAHLTFVDCCCNLERRLLPFREICCMLRGLQDMQLMLDF